MDRGEVRGKWWEKMTWREETSEYHKGTRPKKSRVPAISKASALLL